MRSVTCCFAGHRLLPKNRIESITKRLSDEIDNLYRKGVTEYISGGAIGFDQLAAEMILSKREQGYGVHLIFALPCKGLDESRSDEQRRIYNHLLQAADEIVYSSEVYTIDCISKRNHYMVDSSAFCICAMIYEKSGTGRAVRYAYDTGVNVINIAEKTKMRQY